MVKLNFGIRAICLLIASLVATPVLSQGMSGWSDKTVCRLVESDGGAAYVEEASSRGLDCKAPIKAVKAKPKSKSSSRIDTDGGSGYILEIEDTSSELDGEVKKAAIALNHLHSSLNKIVTYNDKVVLEQEYDNIINNIDLTAIEDREIVEVITHVMDTLTYSKITETEKEHLQGKYQEKLDSALTDAITGLNFTGRNPLEMAMNIAVSSGSLYMDYKTNQNRYKKDLDKGNWQLDKASIIEINDVRKDFIKTYWEIMKRYNMPDRWRVSEKQFQRLHSVLRGSDSKKQYRQLIRMEKELEILPDYWFELALIAKKIENKEAELNAIQRYESLNDTLLRHNSYHSLLLANKTMHMDVQTERQLIAETLVKMLEIDPMNPERKLFAALKYMQIDYPQKGEELLNQNIDDNFLSTLSQRLKIDMFISAKQDDLYAVTIEDLLAQQNLLAGEYLYYLGKRPLPLLVEEITSQVKAINLTWDKTPFGNDDLQAVVPKGWVLRDIENTEINATTGVGTFQPTKIGKATDSILYTFEDVLDYKAFTKEEQHSLKLEMVIKGMKIKIDYAITLDVDTEENAVTEDNDKESGGFFGGALDNSFVKSASNKFNVIKDTTSGKYGELASYVNGTFVFEPIYIYANDKCFNIKESLQPCN